MLLAFRCTYGPLGAAVRELVAVANACTYLLGWLGVSVCLRSCHMLSLHQGINKKEFLKIMKKRGENPLDDLDSDDDED